MPGGGLSVKKHPEGVFSEEPDCRGGSGGAGLQGKIPLQRERGVNKKSRSFPEQLVLINYWLLRPYAVRPAPCVLSPESCALRPAP